MKTALERAAEYVEREYGTGAAERNKGLVAMLERMLNKHATEALCRAAEVATREAWRASNNSKAPDAAAIADGILALRPRT